MIVIGLIGRIGAGKSTVAGCFADLGAAVIDADAIAHLILDTPDARAAIVARFGSGVLDSDGRVLRRALAERVFGHSQEHAESLAELESIVHPRVHDEILRRLDSLRAEEAREGLRVAVLDVPLLVRAGWADSCDLLVAIECDEEVRRRRLADRGVSAVQQAAREAAWRGSVAAGDGPFPGHFPASRTATVDTSGSAAYTRDQVVRIWQTKIAVRCGDGSP
jgi:dephospho-CoA kinase